MLTASGMLQMSRCWHWYKYLYSAKEITSSKCGFQTVCW